MTEMNRAYAQAASALLDEAQRQQQEVSHLLGRLNTAVTSLERTEVSLPATLSVKVDDALALAATRAASEIAKNWTAANTHADMATKVYQQAATWAPWRVTLLCLFALFSGIGAMLLTAWLVLPNPEQLAQLRMQEAEMTERIRVLQARGGATPLVRCFDQHRKERMCVLVDESASVLKGYRVIKGY
jgi:hypothetical protein